MAIHSRLRFFLALLTLVHFTCTYKLILPTDNNYINLGESAGSLTYAS